MSFREQVCPGCGIIAYTHCRYCHSMNHDKDTCPALAGRRKVDQQRKEKEQQTSDSCLSISVEPSPHNDITWRKLPESIRNNVTAIEPFVLPELHEVFERTLSDLVCGSIELEGAETLPYSAMIHQNGGMKHVLEHLLNMVLPEVKALAGHHVTPELLQETRKQQKGEWTGGGGYLDFVTDDRDPQWLKLYVGQYTVAVRRILRQHSQSILNGSYESLHYFILWMGNGHRAANFLRLWQFPDSPTDPWYKVRANILEYCFCKAFRSLVTIHADSSNRTPGLNVLSPLVQGGGKSVVQCLNLKATEAMRGAADPQIRCWPDFRQATKRDEETAKARPILKRPLFRIDYLNALREAGLDDKIIEAVQNSISSTTYKPSWEQSLQNTSLASLPIIGSLSARVGFVLDFESCPPAIGVLNRNLHAITPDLLPWTIASSGFTMSNTLVWTSDFTRISTLRAACESQLSHTSFQTTTYLADHRALIHRSQVSIIILCGEKANELLRLVVSLLGLKEIRPYFIETTSVLRQIFRGMVYERRGLPAMTSDNIPEGIRLWLCRKGIDRPEHIRKIESIAGSLNWGLLMVVGALPRIGQRSNQAATAFHRPKKRQRLNKPFDPNAFATMKAFVTEMLNKEDEAYHQRLNALQPEPRHADALAASSLASDYSLITRQALAITKDNIMEAENDSNDGDDVKIKIEYIIEQCRRDEENTITFEPEHEAELDFVEQLSGLTVAEMELDHDSDSEYETVHVEHIPALCIQAERLDIQPERQAGELEPVPRSRVRTKNIPVIPIKQLNGSQIRINNSGA
ncbi:hypothetical protein F5Y07DRAFT_407170 [Xylaria sp. FL0933]|nr:hypothetical protein F5Y07DRAFT_407170 [Xylaria sp. FL0933]